MEIINITAHRYQTKEISNLAADFVKFKAAISKVKIDKDQEKDIITKKGGKIKFKYSSFDNILSKVTPVLSDHNLTVIQGLTGEFIETTILHSTGELIGVLTPFEPMQNNYTTSSQNIGGGITYISRYAYKAVLGLCLEDDTDGEQEKEQHKETLTADRIEWAANIYLKTGTLSNLDKKYLIPENTKVQIYFLAKELKDRIKAEAEQKKEQEKEHVKQN
jgi:hypothetical protein